MHVAVLCEEKKPSECKNIDVDHEGEKLSYGEYLARYYFVHRLANNYDNEIDIKNKKTIDDIAAVVKVV